MLISRASPPVSEPADQRLLRFTGGAETELRRIGVAPVYVSGVPVHPVTVAQTLDFVVGTVEERRRAVLLYANAHAVNLAQTDRGFMELLRSASLVCCDGKGMQWASRWLGTPLPERMIPQVLLVGFVMPLQEKWIAANLTDLEANVVVAIGPALDYVAGKFTRASGWMTDHGLEWLGRLVVELRRLWRRYLVGNGGFVNRVSRQSVQPPEGGAANG